MESKTKSWWLVDGLLSCVGDRTVLAAHSSAQSASFSPLSSSVRRTPNLPFALTLSFLPAPQFIANLYLQILEILEIRKGSVPLLLMQTACPSAEPYGSPAWLAPSTSRYRFSRSETIHLTVTHTALANGPLCSEVSKLHCYHVLHLKSP